VKIVGLGERLRNFLTPFFTYFSILENEKVDTKFLRELEKDCRERLPYIKYWLGK